MDPSRTMPAPDREEVIRHYRAHVGLRTAALAEAAGTPVETYSQGSRVVDERGREYLDCGGFGVFILGHRHPDVIAPVREQLDRHPLTTRVLLSEELGSAAARLAEVAPDGLEYVYFASSGAEAVETAIKLARANRKSRLVAMERGYHGKTLGALSVTGRSAFRLPFRPLLPDVEFIPFGDTEALEAALAERGEETCVLLEPVQAEGGVRLPPPGYLRAVAERCRSAGAMLVVDEIQTGLGRLGSWWGVDAEDVVPDVLVAGKGLTGGVVPVSAVVASEAAFAPFNRNPRLHTSTFSGAPLAMAAARASIDTIEREGIVERARVLGERLLPLVRDALEPAAELVGDVRGRGLLIGIDLVHPRLAGELINELLERRVVVSQSLAADSVVRLTPPAILTDGDVEWLADALHGAAEAVAGRQLTHTAS